MLTFIRSSVGHAASSKSRTSKGRRDARQSPDSSSLTMPSAERQVLRKRDTQTNNSDAPVYAAPSSTPTSDWTSRSPCDATENNLTERAESVRFGESTPRFRHKL
jgi:hypothetical protein